ncbi:MULTISPECIES: hypothetical protein [Microbulbifer]|uniref:Spore coat protein U domain-containing protein n=1 Tax=Microbulbifer elongatus TaxID=86173 RepID=A0ABT1NX16_9GAMM|nr:MULTISPECIES: hypothetical protein [Microbulbifer]MCQ3828336.1 hypothetical protein [Microbulbifer elongatus]
MKKRIVAISAAAFFCANTFAATQGTEDSDASSGSVDITLSVASTIVAKNFDDIPLDASSAIAGQPIASSDPFCVGGVGFAQYDVAFASANGTTAPTPAAEAVAPFELINNSDRISYEVGFANDAAAASSSVDADGTGAIAGTFAKAGDLTCSGDNAKLFVSVPADQWGSTTESGDYTDTLTVTVSIAD